MDFMYGVVAAILALIYIRNMVFGSIIGLLPRTLPPLPEKLPSVSVIVPVFNEPDGIYATLRSLNFVDYPKDLYEVIVVDDHSTDNTPEAVSKAIQEFSDCKITYIRQPKNAGKQQALITGFNSSVGERIFLFDSDVVVEADVFKSFIRELEDPKLGVVGASCGIYNANRDLISQGYAAVFLSMHRWLKQVESFSGTVSVIDGKASGFRRDVYATLIPLIQKRSWLGLHMQAGEDRFVTHELTLMGYKSRVVLEKVSTSAPTDIIDLYKQQLRWRRSGMRDYFETLFDLRRHVMLLGLIPTCIILISRTAYALIPVMYVWILVTGGVMSLLAAQLTFFMFIVFIRIALNWDAYFNERSQYVNNPVLTSLLVSCWMTVDLVITTPMAILTMDEGGWGTRNLSSTATKVS